MKDWKDLKEVFSYPLNWLTAYNVILASSMIGQDQETVFVLWCDLQPDQKKGPCIFWQMNNVEKRQLWHEEGGGQIYVRLVDNGSTHSPSILTWVYRTYLWDLGRSISVFSNLLLFFPYFHWGSCLCLGNVSHTVDQMGNYHQEWDTHHIEHIVTNFFVKRTICLSTLIL